MKPHTQDDLCPAQQQVLDRTDKKPTTFNALKHGLRSEAVLLPNDDAAQFYALRRDLFHLFRPANPAEARCVESMANLEWRIARCRRQQTVYDAHVDGLLFPDGAPAFHICEGDEHDWSHKADDCTRQEVRLTRLQGRARDALLLLQKLRRDRLIAGAMEAEPICWGDTGPAEVLNSSLSIEDTTDSEDPRSGGSPGVANASGTPSARAPTPARTSRSDESSDAVGATRRGDRPVARALARTPATASDDGQSGKNDEQSKAAPELTPALRATFPRKQGEELESVSSGSACAVSRPGLTEGSGNSGEMDGETAWK